MAKRPLTPTKIGQMVKLRGLGYTQSEIADELGVSQSAIQYQLSKLRREAEERGADDTFWDLLIGAGLLLGATYLLGQLLKGK